jgi:apolipoprotein N-acyltransferase
VKRRLVRIGAAAAAAVVLSLAFHPVDAGSLAWVAPIPLLVLAGLDRGRGFAIETFVFGFLLMTIGCWWIYDLTFAGGLATAVIVSLVFFVPFALVLRSVLRHGLVPLIVAAPVVWVAFDWLRSFVLSGFPWLFLAHTQWDHPAVIRVSAWTGAYGLTFAMVSVSAALATVLMRRLAFLETPPLFARGWWLVPAGAAALVLSAALTGAPTPGAERLRVAVIQGNIPQYVKSRGPASGDLTQGEILRRHLNLTRRAVSEARERWWTSPDLVIWSEAVLSVRPGYPDWVFPEIAAAADAPTLVGAIVREPESDGIVRTTNSVLLLGPRGTLVDRYDKVHPVPGSEFIPYREWFPAATLEWIEETVEGISGWRPNMAPGARLLPLAIPDAPVRAGVLICYEVIYPDLSRRLVRDGAGLLVNITNYGWFGESAQLDQALAITAFRAVETGTPVVVAANTGISAVLDASGRVVETLSRGGETKSVEGVLLAEIACGDGDTVQLAVGDGPAAACALLTGVLLSLAILARLVRRKVAS